jgi:UDP-2,3-diacylglucosamine hydrolase
MFLRKVFTSSVLRKMFSSIHPRWGIGLAHLWSHNNRKQKRTPGVFRGEGESLYQFALEKLEASRTDYFIFGHLHAPVNIKIKDATFVILPDWISRTGGYAVFDGDTVEIIYL